MTTWYIDTSAAWKLLVREAESGALANALDSADPGLVSCWLLDTEMRRAGLRNPHVTHQLISDLLDEIDLYEVPAGTFRQAGLLPGTHLRSLDALHLAAAISIGVDAVITYDQRMAASARDLGLNVLSPA